MGPTTFPRAHDKDTVAAVPAVAMALVLAYAALAVVLGGAVVVVAVDGLKGPILLIVAAFAVAAYAIERASRRARNVLAKNAAPVLYLIAALVLPPPASVLIAVVAVAACHLTWTGIPILARLAAMAHTTVVVALMTVLTYIAFGDERLIRAVTTLLAGSAPPVHVTLYAPLSAGAPSAALPTTLTLAALVLAYYVLDTVPLMVFGALLQRVSPLRAWRDLYGRTLPADAAVPCIAILAAVMYRQSTYHAAAALLVPLGLAVYWVLEHVPAAPQDEPEITEQRPVQDDATRLSVVLNAVRALGGGGDLGEVTRTLADAAVRLTRFRSCVVYLYDAHDGAFLPHAASDEKRLDAWVEVPREQAESLMAAENMLGYSYYARAPRDAATLSGRWRAGDALLVPLLLKNGDVIGFLRLDAPADGCAPTAAGLTPIETVAMLGAGVIARLRHTNEVLHLARTDGLTGLLNRRAFEDRLETELQGHLFRRSVALMMIDLDDFGSINNTYGHQIGDEALRLVAGVVRAQLRQSDAGGRYGGDEFVVILPGLDADGALEVAERVRVALVDATTRAASEGRLPQMYTSIGVAVFPHDGASAGALVKAADDALYSSKRLGKNRVSLRGAA